MIIGYVRVSTVEQHEDRQLVTMEKYKETCTGTPCCWYD